MQPDSENDMANSPSGDIFDVRKIRRLIELMNEHELSEIDLRDGDVRGRLRKGSEGVVAYAPAPVPAPAPVAATPSSKGESSAPAAVDNYHVIRSPMVGTFYASPNPDAPPFVKVGDHVGNESTVCVIEAMKVFNEIPAEVKGKVVACLVENGTPVEFGQPLFKIDAKG